MFKKSLLNRHFETEVPEARRVSDVDSTKAKSAQATDSVFDVTRP